jgi:hypothetical protein
MSGGDEAATVVIRLTRAQALAAGSVLSGFVQHQRERLGDGAAANPNFQHVSAVELALEEHVGLLERSGGERRPRRD